MQNRSYRKRGLGRIAKTSTMHLRHTSTSSNQRPIYRAMALLVLALAWLLPAPSQTANVFFPAGSTNYGKSYPEWCIAFHQWFASLETTHHPAFGTAELSTGQSGPVWFLRGSTSRDPNDPGVIPAGTAILLVLVRQFGDPTGCPPWPGWTEDFMRRHMAEDVDNVHDCACEIDGVRYEIELPAYRFQPPSFTFVTPPNNNILIVLEGEPCYADNSPTPTPWTVDHGVSDDIAVLLAPLPVGPHTVSASFQYGNPTTDTPQWTHYLTVVETNLGNAYVFPPDSTPYGKTYAEWAAEKCKWAYSLPIDKHPLADTANLSECQSGEVWFLGGTYNTTTNQDGVVWGTTARSGTVPDGKALFIPVVDEGSATAEGHGTNGQLWARSQFLINRATNVSVSIDGQLVQNVEHYRVRSPEFTWGPLPENNIFYDPANFPGGVTSQSVADGYYLMLRPLPVGTHTLHFTGGMKTDTANGDPRDFEFEQDITYYLTVTPGSLSLTRNGASSVLSWPGFSTTYRLQKSASLASGNWTEVTARRMTNGNVVSVSISEPVDQMFYRLVTP